MFGEFKPMFRTGDIPATIEFYRRILGIQRVTLSGTPPHHRPLTPPPFTLARPATRTSFLDDRQLTLLSDARRVHKPRAGCV